MSDRDELTALRRLAELEAKAGGEPAGGGVMDSIKQGVGNLAAGAVRGAGSIGATIVDAVRGNLAAPTLDVVPQAFRQPVAPGMTAPPSGEKLRAEMDAGLQSMGAQPDSLMFKGGKLAGEIAGTAGAGGVLANGVRAVGATRALSGLEPIVNGVARGLETGGFRVGEMAGTGVGAGATRLATGAATGGASAGLVNPEEAGTGALIGGVLPAATKVAGAAGSAIRRSVTGGGASQEVAQLAARAKELGINIPADRLVDSKPLNALASSLNYIPLSGRNATETGMNSQLNQALSRTFGQDSSNVTMALRKAETDLGGKFDKVLSSNSVNVDQQMMQELADSANRASRELGSDGARIIGNQVDDILAKAGSGQIDAQAAYNIKKTLDQIGRRNSPEAYYANDLKKALMGALNRSLGPDEAKAFAKVRQQYGTMMDLQKLAKNGVEGEVSVARLANMKDIGNPELQELADIAAQFVKPREGQHGAAQRVFGAGGAGVTAGLAALGIPGAAAMATGGAAVMGGGRLANKALNSNSLRNMLLNTPAAEPEALNLLANGAYRAAPLLPGQ
jgi:hypothetical protein